MITDDKNGKKGVRTLRAERLSVGELSINTMISNLEIVNSLWAPISMPFNHEAITTLGQYYCRNIYMYYSSRLVLCEIIINLWYLIQYLIHVHCTWILFLLACDIGTLFYSSVLEIVKGCSILQCHKNIILYVSAQFVLICFNLMGKLFGNLVIILILFPTRKFRVSKIQTEV